MRVFVDNQVITKCFNLYLEELWRLWPRRAFGFTCVVLAGTSEGLAGPRVLEGARCKCCGTD